MIEDQKRSPWIGVMETLDGWGYITAGFSFLVLGMIVFAHAWYMFIATFTVGVLSSVLALIHDLLLVVILLELFRTIINFLKTHVITLEPLRLDEFSRLGPPPPIPRTLPKRFFTSICWISASMCW